MEVAEVLERVAKRGTTMTKMILGMAVMEEMVLALEVAVETVVLHQAVTHVVVVLALLVA